MSQTKAQLVGGVGISTAQNVVVGSAVTINSTGIDVTGIVTATSFSGDGSNLTNTGSTLSAASGSQRVVVTTQTSGTMTASATDGDLTYDANSDTLNTANLHVTGISTLGTTNGIGKVTIGIGTTALLVEGNARVTGILTVGSSSITLDGGSDSITIGSGATITGSGNVNVSGTITGSTGCIRGTFTGSTVCATTGFSGDGASLTNLTAANIPGLPALIPSGASVCEITSSTTWPKPSASVFLVQVWGAGGGGAGGASGDWAPSITWGGPGGSGGGFFEMFYKSPELPPTVPVVIGAGGAGACGRNTANSDTNPGTPGGSSSFGPLVVYGGLGGAGNDSSSTRGGSIVPPAGFSLSNVGGFYGGCAGDNNQVSVFGGGAGGVIEFNPLAPIECRHGGNASVLGGSGGGGGGWWRPPALPGTNCVFGSRGGAPLLVCSCFKGGGCSGSSTAFGVGGGGGCASGPAGVAGCPGGLTAGGGGGGASSAGAGAGGNGGNGFVRIISW